MPFKLTTLRRLCDIRLPAMLLQHPHEAFGMVFNFDGVVVSNISAAGQHDDPTGDSTSSSQANKRSSHGAAAAPAVDTVPWQLGDVHALQIQQRVPLAACATASDTKCTQQLQPLI
jgi:hypothetical protein